LSVRKQKSDSYSENANVGLTIFDAPNVCREIMGKCELLARQVEHEGQSETAAAIANEIRAIGKNTEQMLDAIVASVDQILAIQQIANDEPVLSTQPNAA
jgi:hypothetical protein